MHYTKIKAVHDERSCTDEEGKEDLKPISSEIRIFLKK
jgi:hypothetical protein